MRLLVRRFGKRQSAYNREGVWFEIMNPLSYSFTESLYRRYFKPKTVADALHSGLFYAIIDVNKPYFFHTKTLSEAQFPIALYAQLFRISHDDALAYKKSLEDHSDKTLDPSEIAYASIERRISEKLRNEGYDSVVFVKNLYDEVLFNSKDRSALDNDQIFYFENNVEWLN